MNLVLVGLNHRTAPVEVRERLSFDESRLTTALAELIHREGILEALIVSTPLARTAQRRGRINARHSQ